MRLFLLGIIFCIVGCATITRGTSEQLAFNTVPSGAEVSVVVQPQVAREGEPLPSPGPPIGCVTPCVIQMKRTEKLAVTITKPGFETEAFALDPKVSSEGAGTSLVGNALIGGAIGLTVDAVSGAGLDKCPNPVQITLRPLGSRVSNLPPFDPIAECKSQAAAKYQARDQTIADRTEGGN